MILAAVDVICPHCGGKQDCFRLCGSQSYDGFYIDSCECIYCHKYFFKYLGSANSAMWFDSLKNVYLFKSTDEAKEHHKRISMFFSLA